MSSIGIVENKMGTMSKICKFLSTELQITVCLVASDGFELIKKLNEQRELPTIIIVNINTPKIDGITITDFVAENFQTIKVIALVSTFTEKLIEDFFECGGWGIVAENNYSILGEAIQNVRTEVSFIDPLINFTGKKREHLVSQKQTREVLKKRLGITKRESMFITLNVSGLEYAEIALLMFVEKKTLDNPFANLAKKIEVKNRLNLTLFSLKHGLAKIATFHSNID